MKHMNFASESLAMKQTFKREHVIAQLVQFGVREIEGQPLDKVKYYTLLKTLALKRAAND